MKRVVVVFQATRKETESQALAFGLGAVEGGANIRLRHLSASAPATLEHQGYGHIRNEDIEWADLIGLAIESPKPVNELVVLIEQIKSYQKTAMIFGKSIYLFGSPTRTQSISFAEDSLQTAGFSLIGTEVAELSDDPQYLKSVGQKLGS